MTKEIPRITSAGIDYPEEQQIKRLPFWPRWSFQGFYKGPTFQSSFCWFYWTCNEGEFPNFCIKVGGSMRLFIYLALAPGLKWWLNWRKSNR